MAIKDVKKEPSGSFTSFNAVVCGKLIPKSTGGNYLSITAQDNSGILEFPVFDNIDNRAEKLANPVPCHIQGYIKIWNGAHQINNPTFSLLSEDEINPKDFIPSYSDENIEKAKDQIVLVMDTLLDVRDKTVAVELIGHPELNPEKFEKFCMAPSAQRHHGNKLGGLVMHTAGVVKNLNSIINNYSNSCPTNFYDGSYVLNKSRLLMLGLIHDAEKMNEYEYEIMIRRKPKKRLGHIEETAAKLYEVNNILEDPFNEEELDEIVYSILSHHGQFGNYEPKVLNDWLLHLADMADAVIVENIENV